MSTEHGQDFNGAKVVKKRGARTVGLGPGQLIISCEDRRWNKIVTGLPEERDNRVTIIDFFKDCKLKSDRDITFFKERVGQLVLLSQTSKSILKNLADIASLTIADGLVCNRLEPHPLLYEHYSSKLVLPEFEQQFSKKWVAKKCRAFCLTRLSESYQVKRGNEHFQRRKNCF
jgi:hypothetical protein